MIMLTRWLSHPFAVWAAIMLCVVIRALACIAMPATVESDSLAYFIMAQTFSNGEVMRDQFGQIAFYSPGYPLFLGAIFLVTGASATFALVINIALAALSCWFVGRIAMRLGGSVAATLAVLAFAVWLPSVLGATFIHKENLTTPLLLGFALTILSLRDTRDPGGRAVLAGLLYGAGLLAGASSLLLIGAALWAIFTLATKQRHALLALAGGVLICLLPWLAYTNASFGKPVLTTNSGFNLYLGNNPAATGHFVGIQDTPIGPGWQAFLKANGRGCGNTGSTGA
jgi:4-amino-4-deoxy-L-arabinose transferase-like glycosyltransferase